MPIVDHVEDAHRLVSLIQGLTADRLVHSLLEVLLVIVDDAMYSEQQHSGLDHENRAEVEQR
jgi:hypothetical protein